MLSKNFNQRKHLLKTFNSGIRYDGRKFDEYRDIKIEYGVSETAEGSATVHIGDTTVMAGVKLSLEKPYSDTPDKGNLMVGAEFLPMSNPNFEPGPPTINSIELARVTDRAIRESGAIDYKKLCRKVGEEVWVVSVDICIINDAGNLFDAASISAMAAIKDSKFPEVVDGVVDYKHKSDKGLELEKTPIGVTVLKIGDKFIVDPTNEEQELLDARLTVGMTEGDVICALQKGGAEPISTEDVDKMISIATVKINEIRKLL